MNRRSVRARAGSPDVPPGREIEESLDRRFFRPAGSAFARLFDRLGLDPNHVSVIGMFAGAAAAPFILADRPGGRVAAVALLWLAEILDAADGQLARRKGAASFRGSIVDGLCSMIAYLLIYAALGLLLFLRTGQWGMIALAAVAAASHSAQSALYEFYRSEYVRFAGTRPAGAAHRPPAHGPDARAGLGQGGWLLWLYRGYARRQIWMTPTYQPLLRRLRESFPDGPGSAAFVRTYRRRQRPMVRAWNHLGPNAHLILLSAALLARRPEIYLAVIVVAGNLYAMALTWAQGRVSRRLLRALDRADERRNRSPMADRVLAGVP